MKIGLFGGSFDPIHIGHLILAQSAMEQLNLDKVIFIPSLKPPHKKVFASIKDRLTMLKLAIKNNPKFKIDHWEIKRKKVTYTYQLINYFKKKFKKDELYFIIGEDSLYDISNWTKGTKLLKMLKFVVGKRNCPKNKKLIESLKNSFILLSSPIIEVSSTEIRNRIPEKKNIDFFTTPEVVRYIKKQKIYE